MRAGAAPSTGCTGRNFRSTGSDSLKTARSSAARSMELIRLSLGLNECAYMCIYIYMHIFRHISVFVCVYVFIFAYLIIFVDTDTQDRRTC